MSSKRTCDACVSSKVKCSGGHPCSRCSTRNLDCFYRARKKRIGSRMRQQMLLNGQLLSEQPAPAVQEEVTTNKRREKQNALEEMSQKCLLEKRDCQFALHQRVAWSVFFTMYKNYRTNCCKAWFIKQLKRLAAEMSCTPNESCMTKFMQRIEDDFPEKPKPGSRPCAGLASGLHFHVPGTVCSALPGSTLPNATLLTNTGSSSTSEMRKLFLTNFDQVPHVQVKIKSDDSWTVTVNEEFTKQFGVSEMRPFGLLPWAADVLCYVCPSEADILAFVQVCAINFLTEADGGKLQLDSTKMIPSTHTPQVRLGNGQIVPCLIKCIHRERVCAEGNCSLEMDMTLEPVPVPPLQPTLSMSSSFSTSTGSSSSNSSEATPNDVLAQLIPMTELSLFDGLSPPPPSLEFEQQEEEEELGETLFPMLDFGLDDELFFKDLLDFANDPAVAAEEEKS